MRQNTSSVLSDSRNNHKFMESED